MARRLAQLYAGLLVYGFSTALMLRAGLGLQPWDVLHEGLARTLGVSFGAAAVGTGALTLLLWIPLGERPGIGTVSNVLVVGAAAEASLAVLPAFENGARWAGLALGIGLNAVATGAYIGAGFGAGPRDGLMTGVARRTGGQLRVVRACIEVVVLTGGWALGGAVGVGTLLYALLIGPLVQLLLPWCEAGRETRA